MKSRNIVLIIALAFLVYLAYPQDSFGGARFPCCIEWSLEKTEYIPGETVRINFMISEELIESDEEVTVKIIDVMYGPDHSNVVFEQTKKISGENLFFEYKLPENEPERYRYKVDVESPAYDRPQMFFAKKDASKIILSDIRVVNPVIKQGEPIEFQVKAVDGTGNPFHYLRISASADIPHQHCNVEQSGWAGAHTSISPLNSIQPDYWSSGIIKGQIKIDDTVMPGDYEIMLYAKDEFRDGGYQRVSDSFSIKIEQNDEQLEPPYRVIAPFEFTFGPGIATEHPVTVSSFTAYNGCGKSIPNVPIKADIKRYDYGTSQWMETVVTKETISDENGLFSFEFEPIGPRPGSYFAHLTTTYQGIEKTFGSEFPDNIKEFTITEEGKEFTVTVNGNSFIPQDVSFDKEAKTLTIELDTADSRRQAAFSIPTELLDGDFIVLVNGIERDGNIRKTDGYTHFSPWPGDDDHTKIEVIGTSAIPEFQTVAMLVLMLSILPVIIFRNKILIRK